MKPYECTEKEKGYLKEQYNEFLKYFEHMEEINGDNQVDLNHLQTMVSMNVCFMEALRRILITKGIATKEEINSTMNKVFIEELDVKIKRTNEK